VFASAQISIYPLRQERLDRAIAIVHTALAARGFEPQIGAMSTLVTGESALLFAALSEAFAQAAETGPVVMTITVSNTCPVTG
jgi:uncharacterized protein YqgV (UPF0045/DUF77 family)